MDPVPPGGRNTAQVCLNGALMALLDVSALKRAEMFSSLGDDELKAVVSAGTVRRLMRGQRIFGQGDAGTTCHNLLHGRVKILQSRPDGAQSVIRYIGPGEMYGTVAALMGKPFPADAVSVVESVEVYWPVETLRALMRRFPEIALRSTASAGGRLMELQTRMGELSGERVEQRLARTLLRLADQAGRPHEAGVEIDFPITRQELAELAGSTLHTVSRTLSAWDDRGLTESSRRHIVVRSPDALRALAEAAPVGR